jgi:type I restriction enzyme S subunit
VTWLTKTIAEFCKTGTGSTPLRAEGSRYYGGSIPWVKPDDLSQGIVLSTVETLTEEALDAVNIKVIEPGALLVSLFGPTVCQIAELGIRATTNQTVCYVIPDTNIVDKRYLYYALRRQAPIWIGHLKGSIGKFLSEGVIKRTEIPLPPLSEQRRIASILDKAEEVRKLRVTAAKSAEQLVEALTRTLVPIDLYKKLAIGISSRSLFELEESNNAFELEGKTGN